MSLYTYEATITRVIDGDTLELTAHLGFHVDKTIRVRLRHIDAPEVRGEEREAGNESAEALRDFLAHCAPKCRIQSFKGKSFGRYNAEVVVKVKEDAPTDAAGTAVNLSHWMIGNGYAEASPE